MEELWKDIDGWTGKYQISNLGRVKTLNYKRTKKEKIMTGITDIRGYKSISFREGGAGSKQKHFLIHRLVAKKFVPNPDNKPFVNHIDGDRSNNAAKNLEWVTRSENEMHKIYILGKSSGTCIPPQKVLCVETGEKFISQSSAARAKGVTQSSISYAVCSGRKSAGYHWRKV